MAKREKKKKKPMQIWTIYESKSGKVERKNKICPKCGPGYFMAQHKDRLTCGNCHYTEFTEEKIKTTAPETQKPEEKAIKEEKAEEKKEEPEKEKSEAKEVPKEEKPAETEKKE